MDKDVRRTTLLREREVKLGVNLMLRIMGKRTRVSNIYRQQDTVTLVTTNLVVSGVPHLQSHLCCSGWMHLHAHTHTLVVDLMLIS